MVLNNKPQMFSAHFPSNFFYNEVEEKWSPFVERMKLPYQSVCDFMNAQIQSVNFPGIGLENSEQQREQYVITYPGGKEYEAVVNKNLDIVFKLTESYVSYFILMDQIGMYLRYAGPGLKDSGAQKKAVWMEPFHLQFISDAGFGMTGFVFQEITPRSLTDLQLSYAAQAATYNTFTFGITYNRYMVF